MHWPEQLIVGGATRNSTSALRSARALQTVVQLMGEREMYEYWADHYKVHQIGWNQEKAAAVLDAWQRKFAAVSTSLVIFLFITFYCLVAIYSSTVADIKHFLIIGFRK